MVGDAKLYTRGKNQPSGKLATIGLEALLLKATGYKMIFLIFGADKEVPEMFLERYGNLCKEIIFFFLDTNRKLTRLN
jgi:hypothetical protein